MPLWTPDSPEARPPQDWREFIATLARQVRELQADGVTVVLTTHAMDEAEQLCDRVGIIVNGRLVTCGTPAELTLDAASDETRFSAAPGLDCRSLARAVGVEPGAVLEERPGEYLVTVEATPAVVADLAA